ncbi:c-type cytochrome [Rhodobacterales bacterium HKCCSP123]|nr:c-type cytochrome [Rhodobacterales bacterium HKCCSP123]
MRRSLLEVAISGVVFLGGALGAAAQDTAPGYTDYGFNLFQENCAVCHGQSGHGDGSVAELFAVRPRDLSMMATENGGVFPFEAVAASIDGRQMIRGHGSEMPVWGNALSAEAQAMVLPNMETAEEVVQGRILAITYYLQSIQR